MRITKISRFTTGKDNKPLINKNGKPYTRVSIKVAEHGDTFLSGFGDPVNESWKEGDDVEIIVDEVESNGKKYLNFSMPKKIDKGVETILKSLDARITALEKKSIPHLNNGEVSAAREDYPWDKMDN